MRQTIRVRVASVFAAAAVAGMVTSAGAVAGNADRTVAARSSQATAQEIVTWTTLQDRRAAEASGSVLEHDTLSPPALRSAFLQRLKAGATRLGAAPKVQGGVSLDGPITVQQGATVRSFDPVSGATSTPKVPSGATLPVWGPAGDRIMSRRGGTWDQAVLTDEDGVSNRLETGGDGQALALRQVGWSPFGDSATTPATIAAALPLKVNPVSMGWYFGVGPKPVDQAPVVNSYGDLTVSRWTEDPPPGSTSPGAGRYSVTPTSFPDGRQPARNVVELTMPDVVGRGNPAVALPPGGSVAQGSRELIAVPGGMPQTNYAVHLVIDSADGTGPHALANAPMRAVCPELVQVAFAPGHSRVAYLDAAGPSGQECSRTRLWVLDAVNGSYADGTARLVADSAGGAAFTSLSWKPLTPPAFAGRLAGADRVATAVASSRVLFAAGQAKVGVLSSAADFPDALSAIPLAGRKGGTLLMTGAAALDPRVEAELLRAVPAAATVYLTGGVGALSAKVEARVRTLGYQVIRLSGPNRYATAVAIAKHLDATMPAWNQWPYDAVFVADGSSFPDSLVAGPAASRWAGTVVLTNGDAVPAVTRDYVSAALAVKVRDRWVNAIGGAANRALWAQFPDDPHINGLVGQDRYDTAAAVAQVYFWAPSVAGMADGRNWPDAVSGGTAMAHLGMPLLLTGGASAPTPNQAWWRTTRSATDAVVAFGGAAVVPDAAVLTAQRLAGRQTALWGPDLIAAH